MSDRFPTLAEAINAAVELGLRNISTLIPAKVVKWDADKAKADCQILVKQVTEGEDGEREVASWPVIPEVPVQFMGAGDFRITVPVGVGTLGSLIFSHRSMDKWLAGDGGEVDPEFDHDHGLADAVFLPGLRTFGDPLGSVASDVIELSAGGSTNFVALANLVKSELDAIQTALTSHTHSGVTAGAASTGASNSSYTASDVAASKVKAE